MDESPRAQCENDRLVVAKIIGCYGLKGWVKVHSYTDPPENLLGFGGWQVKRGTALHAVTFDAGKRRGKGLVAHMIGVDDRALAATYKGLEVVIPRSALPVLADGDYYWRDLQGLQVWCQEGTRRVLLGTVNYLIETGANDVLVVAACQGSIDQRERLIPYLPGNSVSSVDLAAGVIEVDWFVDA
ncbi:MAG: ribosome maturation factor RimM [Halioglobus sp.]|nr:ribosome maturation factor RimM [Halioglobus sp.]